MARNLFYHILTAVCLIAAVYFYLSRNDHAGKKADENVLIAKVAEFFNKLDADKVFTYEDELYFFGEFSSVGSIILLKEMDYIDARGKYKKQKPVYSPLCELIRINKDMLLLKGDIARTYASGSLFFNHIKDGIKKNQINQCLISVQQYEKNKGFGGLLIGETRNILFTAFDDGNYLSFPVLVDGKCLLSMLGFEYCEKDKNYSISKESLGIITTHLKNLE